MICYDMLCHVMSYYIILCYVMLDYMTLLCSVLVNMFFSNLPSLIHLLLFTSFHKNFDQPP